MLFLHSSSRSHKRNNNLVKQLLRRSINLQNLNAASMKHTNVQDVPKYFSIGDEVLLFSPVLHKHTPKTFTEFWTGPYTITRQISPVVFEIQKNDNPEKKDTVHVSRLKLKRTQVELPVQ